MPSQDPFLRSLKKKKATNFKYTMLSWSLLALLLPRDVPHKLERWVQSMKSVCRGNIEICFCSIYIYFLYIYQVIWFIYLSSPSSSSGIYLSIHLSLPLFLSLSYIYYLSIYLLSISTSVGLNVGDWVMDKRNMSLPSGILLSCLSTHLSKPHHQLRLLLRTN